MDPLITLTTDFGYSDHYVGAIKGVILSINPNAKIIDIAHDIPAQDVRACAYIVKNFYKYFPKGTIHMVVVDPGVGSERAALILKRKECTFVAPDNGVLTFVAEGASIYRIEEEKFFLKPLSSTFHARDIFAPVCAYLSLGKRPKDFGPKIKECKILQIKEPLKKDGVIEGEVVYIDRFGNLITNIEGESLPRNALIKIKNTQIHGISKCYSDAPIGALLAVIGSGGMLEISVNSANASFLLGCGKGEKVFVLVDG